VVCRVGKIAELMDHIAPEEWAEPWDNVGLLLGDRQYEVKRLMAALDITPSVVEEAVKREVDMIITHHPIIFNPVKKIVDEGEGKLILPLISNNIAVYCAHTNLDIAEGGVDDSLAKTLGLKQVKQLNPESLISQSKPGFGRWGKLDPTMSLTEFADFVAKTLNTPRLDLVGVDKCKENQEITTVALCGGSGSDFMRKVKEVGADLFITGEIKYHDALMADLLGIRVMTVGHFYSERPIISQLISRLQKAVDSLQYKVEIFESQTQRSPYYRMIFD